ncbi:ACP S-malonyltransferase [Gulosibacter bifidus]|uniref:Malonyl CoA-acyl carrier protein transacylase n=1 Tax=Gulosibacter bifidus TaxID=272239 RepID=A0ABW5RHH8_9MICO|nr:ACP S-malonyltransferase [Gulosibacter bifidus]
MTVFTFPGQGSQTPGFLAPWLEDETARTKLATISDAIGCDLITHGTESDAETIRDTAIAQPLIVAAGILTWDAFVARGMSVDNLAVAGHSVGEITAAYAAGIFDAETAMRFVAQRAQLMAADAAAVTTSMSAVLGGVEEEVIAYLEAREIVPANFNGAGQIVAAGTPEALADLKANPAPGTRVIPLKVAGAFHTHWMQTAHDALNEQIDSFPVADPKLPIYTNADGTRVESGETFRQLLVDQVSRPVRWNRCMDAFARDGHRLIAEATPAGTLTGLAKRALPEFDRIAINAPADIDALIDAIAE